MARPRKRTALLPQRHTEPDLFVCDILDATPKSDRASMEHPLFSLSVKKDMAAFEYQQGNVKVKITPAAQEGRANVFDRDILIYVLSQLMAAQNEGQKIGRRVQISAHDLLKATNRHTTGQAYATLRRALTRLQFTQIETNIHDHGLGEWRSISFITDARIVKEDSTGRLLSVELEMGDWLVKAIENKNVLTLNKAYFQLRKPLERRIYELARKHCGTQDVWRIGLDKLQHKTGSTSTPKEFKRLVKAICKADEAQSHMPDYRFRLVHDILEVTPKSEFRDIYADGGHSGTMDAVRLSTSAYERARVAAPGWDVHYLEQAWRNWMADGVLDAPGDPDKAFLGFCAKWFEKRGRP
ncbi:Replication initiator protein A [Marinovum algicola]|uniref:Replication initiator protein A n=1 Tax=Marinovum algicola TaxID=42444 RepID=A0A975WFP2_9RHOB|nr:Replication initiator protein A [Marinovum algicola]SLN76321.1 Replication initiator protein A [Marinovum algicola]